MFAFSRLRIPGFLAIAVGALIPALLSAQLPSGFQEKWERVSLELRDTLEASGMVGASWAFILDGELVAHETFGHADIESSRAVDEATIYHWGSITKTLTGIAILQL